MYLFDTHCHLQDDLLKDDIDGIMRRAAERDVAYMQCCSVSENDWPAVIELSRRYLCIIPALGIHPWYLSSLPSGWLSVLEKLLLSDSRIAVGEIGLDYMLPQKNDEVQKTVFYEQVQLARRLKRPVSIHCRKAWGSLLDMLRTDTTLHGTMIMHSYGGSVELLEELQSYGAYFSFSGAITHEKNRRCREAAVMVRSDRLLMETDSPDMLPVNYSGPNEPSNLPVVAQCLADLRSVSFELIADSTTANAETIFFGRSRGEQ